MGELRDQMRMEMELRNLSPKTIQAYLGHMTTFTRLFGRSPADMGEEEIRKYLHHLKVVKKGSWSNINIAYCALKFFYVATLHRDWNVEKIPRPKGEKRLPIVLSPSEVRGIFEAIENFKHRVILMTTYSAGLRVSEVAHLQVKDIDSQRKQIRVAQGKGKKDRYTLLSERLLESLRDYYRRYRPQTWLFPGTKPGKPIDVATIQKVFKQAKKKPGSRSLLPSIPCAIALLPICWKPGSISSRSRSSWAMPACRPPVSISISSAGI